MLLHEFFSQVNQLFEAKITSGTLKNFLNSPYAENILLGFEAEMAFGNLPSLGSEDDWDYDWDEDRNAESIDDIVDFFSPELSSQGQSRLREELTESFYEWLEEQASTYWDDVQDERVLIYLQDQVWDDGEKMIRAELEDANFSERQIEEIISVGTNQYDASKYTDEQIKKFGLAYRTAYTDAYEGLEDLANDIIHHGADDSIYDTVYEEVREEIFSYNSEADWLNDIDSRMSGFMDAYELQWPYYTSTEENEYAWSEIAESLSDVVGKPVIVSASYHGATRDKTSYIIEPDSSIDVPGYAGIEIISPPMPLAEAVDQIKNVFLWAKDQKAKTNKTTGFHINLSLPLRAPTGEFVFKQNEVDYVKMLLFMGDQHVLEIFDRLYNSYAKSAIRQVEHRINENPEIVNSALQLLRKQMSQAASELIGGSVGEEKYTSAHKRSRYVEFRSPGGDYISGSYNVLIDTALRFAWAMTIAADPEMYRKEYLKKLYQLINPKDKNNPIGISLALFARHQAGLLTADELKYEWAKSVIERMPVAENNWELYNKESNSVLDTVEAPTQEDAESIFKRKHSSRYPHMAMYGFDDNDLLGVRKAGVQKSPALSKAARREELARALMKRYNPKSVAVDNNDTVSADSTDNQPNY